MGKKLFVGGLAWGTNDEGLRGAFEQFGEVSDAKVILDRDTGRSRGFGFVEIDASDVAAVISATNGRDVDGRQIRVNEAEDKRDAGGRGGSRGGSRGRY